MTHAAVKVMTPKRTMFAMDLEPAVKQALEDLVETKFPDETPTSIIRLLTREFISCNYTEKQLKDRGLLPFYKSQGQPELMLASIKNLEKLRREHGTEPGETGGRKK